MARKKDLAGLAALGALGYALSRGKGGEPSAVTATEESVTTSPVRSGEVEETQLDSMGSIPRSRPAATRAVAPKLPANPNYGNEGRRPVREAPSAYETPYDRMNRKNAEASQAKADTDAEVARLRGNYPAKGRGVIDTSRVNPNTLLPYKKGGKVKKMAAGGRTASQRADGIASKGKTKCKMY